MTTPIYVFNKYYILYHNIISLAISQNRYKGEVYYENHHIIPKSFGGSNDPENLVLLTAREHYICHYLLTKFTTFNHKTKMIYAFNMMGVYSDNQPRHTSKLYEYNKIKMIYEIINRKISDETREKMRIRSSNRKHTEKSKKLISISRIGIKNPNFKGYYVTPWGAFSSSIDASLNTISYQCIRKYCKHNNKTVCKQSLSNSIYLKSLKKSPLGKTYKSLGFSFEETQ